MSQQFIQTLSYSHTDSCPWIVWKKEEELSTLKVKEQTDSRSDIDIFEDKSGFPPPDNIVPTVPAFQRSQYNAVLSKLRQASHKAGTFSNWDT